MALSREMMGAAVQMLGRAPSEKELQDPQFMQRLAYAADQSTKDGTGDRQNLSWVDELMAPAASVNKPAAQNASLQQPRASSGKGDRLDAKEAPLPPRRPADLTGAEPGNQQTPLPPRRPSDLDGDETGKAIDTDGDGDGVKSLARGMAAQRSNVSPDATPAMRTPAAAGRVQADEGLPPDVQEAIGAYNETHPVDDYFGPSTGNNTNYRDEVSGAQKEMQKVAAAGIDPSTISAGQLIRMQTMGVDRWIAEQLDQNARNQRRANDRRATGYNAAKK